MESAASFDAPANENFAASKGVLFLGGEQMGKPATHQVSFANRESVTVGCDAWRNWEVAVGGPGAPAIGTLLSCRATASKIALWYHGGPFAAADPTIPPEQIALLANGYDVFVPFYALSANRNFIFSKRGVLPNLRTAEREAGSLVDWAHRYYRSVLVVGESFGAVFAAKSRPHLSQQDRLLALNPFFGTPEELIGGFRPYAKEIKERAGIQFNDFQQLINNFSNHGAFYSDGEVASLLHDHRTMVVYSPADERVDARMIDRTIGNKTGSCKVDRRKTNGHEFSRTLAQYQTFVSMINCQKS